MIGLRDIGIRHRDDVALGYPVHWYTEMSIVGAPAN